MMNRLSAFLDSRAFWPVMILLLAGLAWSYVGAVRNTVPLPATRPAKVPISVIVEHRILFSDGSEEVLPPSVINVRWPK